MKHVGVVDAEGGPLLLGDAKVVRLAWRGTEGDGSDYERACKLLDGVQGHSIALGAAQGLLWDMAGPGTADVFTDQLDGILIMRTWIENEIDIKAVFELAALPLTASTSLGSLRITSGLLVVLSSVESGKCLLASDLQSLNVAESARPTGDMSTTSSGLLVRVPIGNYLCLHDEVELEDGQSARRCFLSRIKN